MDFQTNDYKASVMVEKKNEKERKELNNKLLKNSFKSELKNRKKVKPIEVVFDFIGVFIALYLANLIKEIVPVDFGVLDMVITAVIIIILFSICTIFKRKIKTMFQSDTK